MLLFPREAGLIAPTSALLLARGQKSIPPGGLSPAQKGAETTMGEMMEPEPPALESARGQAPSAGERRAGAPWLAPLGL